MTFKHRESFFLFVQLRIYNLEKFNYFKIENHSIKVEKLNENDETKRISFLFAREFFIEPE